VVPSRSVRRTLRTVTTKNLDRSDAEFLFAGCFVVALSGGLNVMQSLVMALVWTASCWVARALVLSAGLDQDDDMGPM